MHGSLGLTSKLNHVNDQDLKGKRETMTSLSSRCLLCSKGLLSPSRTIYTLLRQYPIDMGTQTKPPELEANEDRAVLSHYHNVQTALATVTSLTNNITDTSGSEHLTQALQALRAAIDGMGSFLSFHIELREAFHKFNYGAESFQHP